VENGKELDRVGFVRSRSETIAALAGKFIKRPTRIRDIPLADTFAGTAALIKRRNVADGPGPLRAGAAFHKNN